VNAVEDIFPYFSSHFDYDLLSAVLKYQLFSFMEVLLFCCRKPQRMYLLLNFLCIANVLIIINRFV